MEISFLRTFCFVWTLSILRGLSWLMVIISWISFVLIWYLTVYAGFTQLKTLKEKFKHFNKQNSGLRVLGEDIDMAKCLTDRYKYIFSCS